MVYKYSGVWLTSDRRQFPIVSRILDIWSQLVMRASGNYILSEWFKSITAFPSLLSFMKCCGMTDKCWSRRSVKTLPESNYHFEMALTKPCPATSISPSTFRRSDFFGFPKYTCRSAGSHWGNGISALVLTVFQYKTDGKIQNTRILIREHIY